MKLFDLITKVFYPRSTATESAKSEGQMHARIDRKGDFVDIINVDPVTFLEKTKTP